MGKTPRRPGSPWRILVHDWLGRQGQRDTGCLYGTSHHITNRPKNGERSEHSTETVFPGTEFDELVIGRWIHLEQMDATRWWINVGGVTVWVVADRDGRPRHVSVFGPEQYAEPAPGCTYSLSWDGEGFDERTYSTVEAA